MMPAGSFHRIVYAASGESARAAYTACARKWSKRCPGVARSLAEGGDELLAFFHFPKAQRKIDGHTALATVIRERLTPAA